MQESDLAAILKRVPESSATVTAMCELVRVIEKLPIEDFFEHVALVLEEQGKKKLIAVGAADLRSWTRHMAYSVRIRLGAIDSSIIREITHGSLLSAAILLRSHFESAALSVYCLETLTDCARNESIDELADLIHKTLFGTALFRHAAKQELLAEYLLRVETNTIQITRAIEALDRYIYREKSSGSIPAFYGLLCEFAHPNHRGVTDFVKSETIENGWMIRYSLDQPFDPELVQMLLDNLLLSMQCGYSACEMLRGWDFADSKGSIRWIFPSVETAKRVWTTLLQRK